MLPLYSSAQSADQSSFRIRQRASTPGNGRRRKQPGTWEQQQQHGVDHVTIAIPEDTTPTTRPPRYDSKEDFVKSWKVDYENHLDDFHSVFRTPHFVTDAEYQRHLRGESLEPPTKDYSRFAAQFCSLFSFTGSFILCFIGFLLDTQALYIPGSLPSIPVQSTVDVHGTVRNSLTYEYLIPNTERLYIATTAYRTSGLYFICGILAVYYLRGKSTYQAIPDSSLPTFVSAHTKYDTVWNRVIRRVKRRFRTRKQEKNG